MDDRFSRRQCCRERSRYAEATDTDRRRPMRRSMVPRARNIAATPVRMSTDRPVRGSSGRGAGAEVTVGSTAVGRPGGGVVPAVVTAMVAVVVVVVLVAGDAAVVTVVVVEGDDVAAVWKHSALLVSVAGVVSL